MRTWADDFLTYDDACRYYGCDTPAQLEAEAAYEREEALVVAQDDLEAHGGPLAAGQASAREYATWCARGGLEAREHEVVERVFPGYLRREPATERDLTLLEDGIPF